MINKLTEHVLLLANEIAYLSTEHWESDLN